MSKLVATCCQSARSRRNSFEVKCSEQGEISPAVYSVTGGVWDPIGSPTGPFLHQVALVRDAGLCFISTGMPTCWYPPEEPQSWEAIDKVMHQIIEVHPQALIVPRVSANAPAWWLERHPETRMMFEDGTPGRLSTVSSHLYRGDISAHMEKLCRHLCEALESLRPTCTCRLYAHRPSEGARHPHRANELQRNEQSYQASRNQQHIEHHHRIVLRPIGDCSVVLHRAHGYPVSICNIQIQKK